MVSRTSDWRDELGRWLKPFLDRLGHKARRQKNESGRAHLGCSTSHVAERQNHCVTRTSASGRRPGLGLRPISGRQGSFSATLISVFVCLRGNALASFTPLSADQAAAFAKRAVEQNKFQRGSREPYDRIMGWLLSRVGRS